jgi:RND family efflux transporter MFP subunit
VSKRVKRWVVPLAILGVGVVGVLLLLASRPRVEPDPPAVVAPLVRVVPVAPGDFRFLVRAQGTVVPRTESELVPQVSGEVVWISPSLVSGGSFEAGEPLLRIERADYEVELESARATEARTASELARARKELERQRKLAARSVASQSRIDDAENAFRVAEAARREARARVERASRDLARTELTAAYQGRVREERVDVGQFVSRGSPVATLYAVDWAEVRLPLPDRELAFLDLPLGRRAATEDAELPEVRLRAEFAGEQHVWTGRIVRTEGEIDPQSRMVNAVARVEDPYGRNGGRAPLAVGLFVEAEILGRRVENAVVLPRSALRDGERVLVVDDGRLRFRKVEVLRIDQEQVLIASGLSAGESICVSPLPGAVDGMSVRIVDAEPAVARATP